MVAFSTNATVNSFGDEFHLFRYLLASNAGRKWRIPTVSVSGITGYKVVDIVRQASGRPASAFISEVLLTLSHNAATYQGKPKTLWILLQESFGAQCLGHWVVYRFLPNIDRLAKQGWLFENLYATGTRSVRGIEAVVTGFNLARAQAVVKLNKSQSGFFTLAELLG